MGASYDELPDPEKARVAFDKALCTEEISKDSEEDLMLKGLGLRR